MTRLRLDTEIRQEQIARAALGLVADRGLKGLRVAAVARRAGLVPSGIYRHYRSKDGVLDAVLDMVRNRLLGNVQAVCDETADPLERLRRLLERHVRLIREHHALPRIIFSEEVFGGTAARRAKLCGIIEGYLGKVEAIVREGQAAGAVRRDVDARTLAVMFLGLVQPAAILWHLSGMIDIVRQAREAWRIFREAVQTSGRPA